jgi:hypothetical protein
MRLRLLALVTVVALLAGIVQLPLAAVAATTALKTAAHSHHHCCPGLDETPQAALVPTLPGLPCGPNHSCCVVRAPAKLPSLPAASSGKADRRVAHVIQVSLPIPDETLAVPDTEFLASRGPLDRSTVLRV